MSHDHKAEVTNHERFEFGANWSRFLGLLNDERIERAKTSLREFLGVESLHGKTFLDAGSGSGLFSLAARMLGAKVHSFDYDPKSVACTLELRRRYFPDDESWKVDEASVLDLSYLEGIGKFDVVYSWGVLHHTGAMRTALHNVSSLVANRGKLFIAIYNDQGWVSQYWKFAKKCYTRSVLARQAILISHLPYLIGVRLLVRAATNRLDLERGMSIWYDMIDWIGGYPFEVARPDEIFEFYHERGFRLATLRTCAGRLGCNEFVFDKTVSLEDS